MDANDNDECTSLHLLCQKGSSAGLEDLKFDSGADDSDWNVFEMLLDRGADVEAKTKTNLTPLEIACESNQFKKVWELVHRNPWLLLKGSACQEERPEKRQRIS